MTTLTQKIQTLIESIGSKKILIVLGCIVASLAIFQIGVAVGGHKVRFEKDWNNNYYENFGPRHEDEFIPRPGKDMPNAHGAAGKILNVNPPRITIEDRDQTEKIILLTEKTTIMRKRDAISPTDLQSDEYVVIIGNPNDQGQIEAKFIRTLPTPPQPEGKKGGRR